MELMHLNEDFKDFLRLLTEYNVRYLLIGGYAVAFHGYPRTTNDLDIWISIDNENATSALNAIKKFGYDDPELTSTLLQTPNKILRMGLPPNRLEIHTSISGVEFDVCYSNGIEQILDRIPIRIISLENLKENKRASGRYKDLADLENL